MPACGILGLLLTVILTACLLNSVIAGHLGGYQHQKQNRQHTHQERAVQTTEDDTIMVTAAQRGQQRRKTDDEILAAAQDAVAGLPFAARLPETSKPRVNLFEEYMSRGLYTCTSSYLDALGKLHALIAEVYEDYQTCQKMMKTTAKTFSRTDIDALDDMLDEWEREDTQQAAAGSAPAATIDSSSTATAEPRIAKTGAPPQLLP